MTIIYKQNALSLIILLLCCFCINSCISYEQVHIIKTPKPEIIAKGKTPKIMPAGYLKMTLRKQLPELEEIIINDQHYVYITEEWFFQLKEWTDAFIAQQVPDLDKSDNLPVDYKQAYTMFLSSIANLTINKHYNIKSSALIGILVARNVLPWEAIPATGEQMSYIIILDEDYIMVYDLITEQMTDIYSFPNMKHIVGITF